MKRFFKTLYGKITLLMALILIFFITLATFVYRQNIRIRDYYNQNLVLAWLNFNIANHQGEFLNVFKTLDEGILHMNYGLSHEAVLRIEDMLGKANHFDWIKPIDSTFRQSLIEAGIPDAEGKIQILESVWQDFYLMTQEVDQVVAASSDSTRDQDRPKAMAVYNQSVGDISGRFFGFLWSPEFHGTVNNRLNEISSNIQELTGSAVRMIFPFTIGFAALVIVLWFYLQRKFRHSLQRPLNIISRLSVGELPEAAKVPEDEMGPIVEASNKLSAALEKASGFAQEIGKGHFDFDYQLLSEKDILGNALINMKDDLRKYHEKEKIQNWSNEGYAMFSDILRNSFMKTEEMGKVIISRLVTYLEANQGGLFLYDEEAGALQLTACYAYGRNKFLTKSILPGEGLIGQCFLERQTSYYTDVPENYIKITSGMGSALPRSILIVPVKNEEKIEGVLEIASFSVFRDYEIDFVEKVAQNLASVVTAIKRNNITEKLLQDSKRQSEALKVQEEELQNTFEELYRSREEFRRQEEEYLETIKTLQLQVEQLKSLAPAG